MQCAYAYCHLRPAPVYSVSPHYLINGTIFGKKIIEHKIFVFNFYREGQVPLRAAGDDNDEFLY